MVERKTTSMSITKITAKRFNDMAVKECKYGDTPDTFMNRLMDTYNLHKESLQKKG